MPIHDRPLFRGALSAMSLSVRYEYPQGYTLVASSRHEGESGWTTATYSCLSPEEVLDVLSAVAFAELG